MQALEYFTWLCLAKTFTSGLQEKKTGFESQKNNGSLASIILIDNYLNKVTQTYNFRNYIGTQNIQVTQRVIMK